MTATEATIRFALVVIAQGVTGIIGYAVAKWCIYQRQQPLHRWDIDALFLTADEREHFRARKTMSHREYGRLLQRSLADIHAELERRGRDPSAPHKKRF